MAMTDEEKLLKDLSDANKRYKQAVQNNAAIDVKIEALDNAARYVQYAHACLNSTLFPIAQTGFDSEWWGVSRNRYNTEIDDIKRSVGDYLTQLTDLSDRIRDEQNRLRGQKDDLAALKLVVDSLKAPVDYAGNKLSHLGF